MNREIKTPIDKLQQRYADQREKVRLEFSRSEKIDQYRVRTKEISIMFQRECPLELNYTIKGLASLKNLIEKLRRSARLQHRELIIVDKDANTEHRSFSEIANLIEDCHDRQRINTTNQRIRDSYNKRTIRFRKVKKIDMRIYEHRM
jgi:leucyl-tRNA synthetase